MNCDTDIYKSLSFLGLMEYCLSIEGIPIRGLDWISQYPCLVQDVTEACCVSPETAAASMGSALFQAQEQFSFIRIGTRYSVLREERRIEVTVSRLCRVQEPFQPSTPSLLSETHYLIEMSSQGQSAEMKQAARLIHDLYGMLQPWMIATLS